MKNKNLLIFILSFVIVAAFGIVLNSLVSSEQARIAEEKENIINIVKDLGVKTLVEENPRSFISEEDTEILSRLQGYDKDEELVATIYIGKTKGYRDDLNVAYAIDVNTDKVVGYKLLENNETPIFIETLMVEEFTSQFNDKDLADKQMKVEAISGATPNTGNTGVIAPATTGGMDKILKLVRKQYAKDTDFVLPAMLAFKSKKQDYVTLNFTYVFEDEGTEVTLVVDMNYELVSITDTSVQVDALALAKSNKVKNYISKIEGSTVTIKSDGFYTNSEIISTAVLDGTSIVSFTSDLESQSYGDVGGSLNESAVYTAVKNGSEIPTSASSSATFTLNGIWAARDILYGYLEVQNNE